MSLILNLPFLPPRKKKEEDNEEKRDEDLVVVNEQADPLAEKKRSDKAQTLWTRTRLLMRMQATQKALVRTHSEEGAAAQSMRAALHHSIKDPILDMKTALSELLGFEDEMADSGQVDFQFLSQLSFFAQELNSRVQKRMSEVSERSKWSEAPSNMPEPF